MTLLKSLSLAVAMICGLLPLGNQAYADEPVVKVVASTDVEATMKSMSYTYRQAMLTSEANVMLNLIDKLQQLVASVQLVQFDQKRQSVLQQGLTEVQSQLALVHASLVARDINTAKEQLKKVAALRMQYHKERSPSIWQLLFGD
ncbi:MAG: cytochrome b562 [Paraglaciecola polaris]|uniref:cytochrome b562 n=1 Tax=Paraglaciecola polaris TaxID=222814 RepID=UPI003002C401